MIRRIRQLLQGLVALVVAVAVLFAIPVALIELVGWPLPTAWPSLEQLRRFAQVGVSDQTVIKALATVVWIAWAQISIAIVVETAALLRRRTAATLKVLPGIQPMAARLVAAIALIAAASTAPRTAAIAATPLQAVVATAPTTVPVEADVPAVATPQPASDTPATRTVTTTARDSWWRLADVHLGDGLRWRELRDLNVGHQAAPGVVIQADTDQLDGGWQLRVPAADGEAMTSPAVEDATTAQDWEVERGDHFWRIAEESLTDAWGRAPTDAEIAAYWRDLVDHNRDRLAPPRDPDLIYPGQHFEIPVPPDDPTTARLVEEPAVEDPGLPTTPQPAPTPSEAEVPPTPTPTAPGDIVDEAGDGWSTAIERGNTTTERAADNAAHEPDAEANDDDQVPNGLGVPGGLTAGVAATTLLAAGVLALMRWRRRTALRQRPEGYRLPTPLRSTEPMVTRLEAAAAPQRTLDDLASLLCSIPPDVHPALVTTVDDGTVTLLFDDTIDLPGPASPWQLVDDGSDGPVGWVARLGDRGPERSIGLPLMITLGRTGETTVHANVAALPQLTLEGDEQHVRRMLRIASLEAATSRIAVPVEVVVIGDHLLETVDDVRHASDPHPDIDAAMAEIEQGVIPDDRTQRLLVCHPDAPACDVPAQLIGTVGVLAASEAPCRWTLRLEDRDTGSLVLPDGGTVELTLPDAEPWDIDQELRRLEQPPVPADTAASKPPAAADEGLPSVHASRNGNGRVPSPEQATAQDRTQIEPAWCEVRLLGPVEVYRDGERVDNIPPRSLEALIYLVTHTDGVSKERMDDAIWAGQAGRPGTQRLRSAMTKLRDALGDGPDGEPLVPRRTRADRIKLSDHVGCDLDRALAHLAVARDLPAELRVDDLTAALDLVRGEVLEDMPLSWASEVTQRAIAELQDAALELGRICREAEDFDAAEHALRQGLRLLDPADTLYLELAEVESARGRPDRVSALWKELRQRHAADADEVAGLVDGPPPEVELAFRTLLTSVT